jgi:peptide subunit release factor RF-3
LRDVPISTFVNWLDCADRDPFDLPTMIILKSPASSVIFNDGESFTGNGAIEMRAEISEYEGPKRCVAGKKYSTSGYNQTGKISCRFAAGAETSNN